MITTTDLSRAANDPCIPLIRATVKIKKVCSIEICDGFGFSAKSIYESHEELYSDDEEVVAIDVMVTQ